MLHAMIMAGGGGTRFWPRSRVERPKQFLTFSGDRTLLQNTYDRIAAPIPVARVWIITGNAHVGEARHQLPELVGEQIVGEPTGRDTAACVALGASLIARTDPEATMIVMPADHHIEPVREFQRAVHAAEQFAEEFPERLITFGIPPTFPSTGYGYIERGEPIGERQGVTALQVRQFAEKPDSDTAERFLHSGRYYWNSGIFVWKAKTILKMIHEYEPTIHDSVQRIAQAWGTPAQQDVFTEEYESVKKISIDYAVMQKAATNGKVMVMQAPYQWDDVGSWLALERRNPQDVNGNTIQGRHIGIDTSNCVIATHGERLIATIDIKDLLIIQDGNATLIADRKSEARVKEIVDILKKSKEWEAFQ